MLERAKGEVRIHVEISMQWLFDKTSHAPEIGSYIGKHFSTENTSKWKRLGAFAIFCMTLRRISQKVPSSDATQSCGLARSRVLHRGLSEFPSRVALDFFIAFRCLELLIT